MVVRKGENYGGKEGGELWWQGRGITKEGNYGGKEGGELWWEVRSSQIFVYRAVALYKEGGELWWQVKFLFVYRPVALYKEGGELWWQVKSSFCLSIGLWPSTRKGENYGGKEGGELREGLLWCFSRHAVW